MRFLIVDDQENDLMYLRQTIKLAFPGSECLPERGKTFKSWSAAVEFVQKQLARMPDAIVLLDIALGEGDRESLVAEGMRRCAALAAEFPAATLIACTQYDRSVREHPSFPVFKGLFEKQVWDRNPTPPEKARYAYEVIESALPRDVSEAEQLFANATIEDSLGVRTFESVFGADAVKELLFHFARSLTDVRLRSLSGGLSGAFLFEIVGSGGTGRQAIIVKVARDRALIENEVTALDDHFGSLGPIAAHVNKPQSNHIQRLRSGGYYLVQAAIAGEDLLRIATRQAPEASKQVELFLSLLRSCVAETLAQPKVATGRLGDYFRLSRLDFSRFRASTEFFATFAPTLSANSLWPADMGDASALSEALVSFAGAWRDGSLAALECDVPVMVQHGDAHLANVLMTKTGQVLVDVARVGVWPIGYDISRLAVQMRLRLPERVHGADHMPSHLMKWLTQYEVTEGVDAVCPLADMCDRAFVEEIQAKPLESEMQLAYRWGTMWDLLKIASYGDISAMKRVWAMITLVRLARKAGAVA